MRFCPQNQDHLAVSHNGALHMSGVVKACDGAVRTSETSRMAQGGTLQLAHDMILQLPDIVMAQTGATQMTSNPLMAHEGTLPELAPAAKLHAWAPPQAAPKTKKTVSSE